MAPGRIAPMEIHKVCSPPKKTTFQAFKHRVSEIFFPDNPLVMFKGETAYKKLFLGLQYLFPILEWAPNYTVMNLKSDVISGLTLASLAIPQGISYAKLAALPPILGLYSSFVPPLLYAFLGSSRHLAVGPVSIASLVLGEMLKEHNADPSLYLQLALTSTFFAGLFQTTLGILRLGFLIDFLSKATLIGFTAGAAIIVGLQQLKGLLGIVHFTNKMQIIPVMESVFHHTDEWSWKTIVMGIGFLLFLLGTRHISQRKPKLFWISAAAPLVSVVASTILMVILREHTDSVSIIGHLNKGLNPPSANLLYFRSEHMMLVVKTGIVTGILALTEGVAVARTFASMKNCQVDANKEMMAIGVMNMVGSCTSCYITTGSFSRSAINVAAGAETAVSNIVMAVTVLVTLLFLIPLFFYTPNFILAAIIVTAVIGLIDVKAATKLWKVDKLDCLACFCAFFGVLFTSVQVGLLTAVGVSVFKILLQVTRPATVVLGNIPGTQSYRDIERYREASRMSSFIILAIEAPLYFANSTYLQERILRWVREEEELVQANNGTSIQCIILELSAVTAIDSSGLEVLDEIRKILDRRSIQLILVNPVGEVMEKLALSGALENFESSNGVYLSVEEAISDNYLRFNSPMEIL